MVHSFYCLLALVFRSRRTLENRQNRDDEKISILEGQLRQVTAAASEYERKYEEVSMANYIREK